MKNEGEGKLGGAFKTYVYISREENTAFDDQGAVNVMTSSTGK